MSVPVLLVLMSVHNGAVRARHGDNRARADSRRLELIVIDDGSTDATPALLATVRLARARRAPGAAGLTCAQAGLSLARAPLIARLDADDLALPDRLARQRAFLNAHPDVGLLGTGRARSTRRSGRSGASGRRRTTPRSGAR